MVWDFGWSDTLYDLVEDYEVTALKSNVNNNEFHPKFSIPVATKMVQMLNLFLSFLKQ